MSFIHRHSRSVTAGGETITGVLDIETDAEVNEDIAYASNPTVTAANLAVDVSACKSLMLKASTACTVRTNDNSSPDATIVLAANRILEWTNLDGTTNPLGSTDVTDIHITPVSTGGTLQVRIAQDATP